MPERFSIRMYSLWRQMIQKTELKSAGSDPHALERFDAKRQLGS